jgi:hypothetical protein
MKDLMLTIPLKIFDLLYSRVGARAPYKLKFEVVKKKS